MSFTEHIHFFILSNYTNIVILNEVKNPISVSSCIQILRFAQDDRVHYSLYFFHKVVFGPEVVCFLLFLIN